MIIYPLYYILIVSISDGYAVMRGEVSFLPIGMNLQTYKVILQNPMIINSYTNTFLYTAVGTAVAVGLTALCAYPLSRGKMYAKTLFTTLIIFTMFFEGGIIPLYLLIDGLGILNSMWAIVLPPAINVFYMIIMRTFFQQIPNEIHESAYMDGANDLVVFIRMIVPLSMPVFATMMLFYSVWHWNSFFPALIYLNESSKYPVQIVMRNIVVAGEMSGMELSGDQSRLSNIGTNIKYAVIIITMLPILCVYPFIQKYFVKGMLLGSLKE